VSENVRRTKPLSFVSFSKRKEVIQKLNITSVLTKFTKLIWEKSARFFC